ncbi:IPExxxVDY family protein [Salegentibacter sp. F188]|uniref:IPExxxVDY family protein n=1 Tax=Autumnicola patrickiae TaxID=3075591 RepID=A0ABU3E5M3_9FLAO|nr:IPExxxVDY family protein [Salegentibacter sp. F188]MDT0691297.1 IPExxxVDY family protein [Salegentibacter sp. F188]
MQSHKMLLDEVEEDSFRLIAIYCPVEQYKMAYLLNKHLDLHLKRARRDVDFNHKSVQAMYALFTSKDHKTHCVFNLVTNKFKGQARKVLSSGSLFYEEEVRPLVVHLIPEYKKVDFFLKIEEDIPEHTFKRLLNIVNNIPQVLAAYNIDADNLKSKENLIFE